MAVLVSSLSDAPNEASNVMNLEEKETENEKTEEAKNFSGFEVHSFQEEMNKKIVDLRELVAQGRKSIADSRERSRVVAREIWTWRQSRSFNVSMDSSRFSTAEEDLVMEDGEPQTSTPRRQEVPSRAAHHYLLRSKFKM